MTRARRSTRRGEQRWCPLFALALGLFCCLRRRVDRRAGVVRPPRADGVEVFHREPDRVITLWQLAQAGLARCSTICSRIVFVAAPGSGSFSAGTLGGGGAGGVPRMFSSTHLPRSTGDVRVACDVTASKPPLPSSPLRASSSSVYAPELAAVDARYPVVAREPLVEERVVRRQQVENVPIFAHDALEEHLRLARERLAQVVVEIGELVGIRQERLSCAPAAIARRNWRRAPTTSDRPACGGPVDRALPVA